MKDKIGIGIIGTGFAHRTQIPAFLSISEAKIVSVASGHAENAKKTAEEFGIGHFTGDWRETVGREDVDLICITTPPNTHYEMALRSIELGKNVLCEKPMAMNTDEARTMTEMAAEKGVLALIDHELRFTNGRMKAYQMLRDGKIGRIIHAKYHFNNAFRGNEALPWNWWSDIDSGGGALGAIGSHVVDTFCWFLSTKVSEIFCRLQTHAKLRPDPATGEKKAVTSDDEVLMILRFDDNELVRDATAIASLSVVEAGTYRNAVEFFGTNGAIRIEDGGEIFFADINENIWREIEIDPTDIAPKMQDNGWSRGFMNFSSEIVAAILKGETEIQQAATFAEGLQIQRVLDAARESNASGRTVKIL